jgi:hypothetical protein
MAHQRGLQCSQKQTDTGTRTGRPNVPMDFEVGGHGELINHLLQSAGATKSVCFVHECAQPHERLGHSAAMGHGISKDYWSGREIAVDLTQSTAHGNMHAPDADAETHLIVSTIVSSHE